MPKSVTFSLTASYQKDVIAREISVYSVIGVMDDVWVFDSAKETTFPFKLSGDSLGSWVIAFKESVLSLSVQGSPSHFCSPHLAIGLNTKSTDLL